MFLESVHAGVVMTNTFNPLINGTSYFNFFVKLGRAKSTSANELDPLLAYEQITLSQSNDTPHGSQFGSLLLTPVMKIFTKVRNIFKTKKLPGNLF